MIKLVLNLCVFFAFYASQYIHAENINQKFFTSENLPVSKKSCPSQVFPIFMRVFSNSPDIQKAFTSSPLQIQNLDSWAEPEPKKAIKRLNRRLIRFPVFPLAEERIVRALQIRVEMESVNEAKASLFKPDTDYKIDYFFKKNGCWKLVRIEDWSL